MKTNLTWGPDLWHVIHVIAKNYPRIPSATQKNACLQFVKTISYILPCMKCQRHYMTTITKHPVNPHSGVNFFTWTIQLHNDVNRKTDKKKKQYTIQQAFHETDSIIDPKKLRRLLSLLFKESSNNNISRIHLQKFIDCITFLSKPNQYKWSIPPNKKIDIRLK